MTNTLIDHMRKALLTALVQRQIFCPVYRTVLDVDTCAYFVDADGDPCYVMSMEAYARFADTPGIEDRMAKHGWYFPAELPKPGVVLREDS